jgi:hypothetical protein
MIGDKEKLYIEIKKLLLMEWDPIGIREIEEASDEYDLYIPVICQMVASGKLPLEIENFLLLIETEYMGLNGNKKECERVANLLIKLKY